MTVSNVYQCWTTPLSACCRMRSINWFHW